MLHSAGHAETPREVTCGKRSRNDFFLKPGSAKVLLPVFDDGSTPSFSPCLLSNILVLASPLAQLQWPHPTSENRCSSEGRDVLLSLHLCSHRVVHIPFNNYPQAIHLDPCAPLHFHVWKSYEPSQKEISFHISRNGCLPTYQCF